MATLWLLLAYATGIILSWPQLIRTKRFLPLTIRAHQTWSEKCAIGNVPWWRLLRNLMTTRDTTQIDGVFYPEACVYVGLPCVIAALFTHSWHQWVLLGLSTILALGRVTPVFRWLAPGMLRIPARWCYFISMTLVFMGVTGLARIGFPTRFLWILVILQAWDLAMNTARLWPMHPYVQRCERPSKVFNTPLVSYLKKHLKDYRISGLPFPLTTGQMHQFRSLGYNGGFGMASMAKFRGTLDNTMGGGGHSWFDTRDESTDLDWWGVRYAYTYRQLSPPAWRTTPIPHLYKRSPAPWPAPSFDALDGYRG